MREAQRDREKESKRERKEIVQFKNFYHCIIMQKCSLQPVDERRRQQVGVFHQNSHTDTFLYSLRNNKADSICY